MVIKFTIHNDFHGGESQKKNIQHHSTMIYHTGYPKIHMFSIRVYRLSFISHHDYH